MNQAFISRIAGEVAAIEQAGLFKKERIITSEQGAEIIVGGKNVLNFCANNYLGLSSHPKIIAAAKISAADTKDLVKRLETKFGKKIEATVSVDPEIIGGIKIIVGDTVIDASVKGQLQNLAYSLTA